MAPSKHPQELRDRATRLCIEARRDPDSRQGAITRIAAQVGVHKEALRTWVNQAEKTEIPVAAEDTEAVILQLQKENRELRRSNEILKSAAAFFAAEFDRPPK